MLVTTRYGLDEAERNVQRWAPPDALDEFWEIRAQDVYVYPEPSDEFVEQVGLSIPRKKRPRNKDLPIIAGAVSANADWLVTNDKTDFGRLYGKKPCGVEVVRLITALTRLR